MHIPSLGVPSWGKGGRATRALREVAIAPEDGSRAPCTLGKVWAGPGGPMRQAAVRAGSPGT